MNHAMVNVSLLLDLGKWAGTRMPPVPSRCSAAARVESARDAGPHAAIANRQCRETRRARTRIRTRVSRRGATAPARGDQDLKHTLHKAAAKVSSGDRGVVRRAGAVVCCGFVHFKLCICGAAHRADHREQRARTMATLSSYKFCGTQHSRRCSNFGAETPLCDHNTAGS